ncbi:MAG TPA: M15 family metallopeptidase [Egibacteraceae bacterium]|nr:M15 family metallopeptidase [Egibacteraceae bacterium]
MPDGFAAAQDTPKELEDRRLITNDVLPAPPGEVFAASVGAVPGDVIDRSTWTPECPVAVEDLRYATVTFWGFDGRAHTGELLVHADVADDVIVAFERIYDARFPIEEMRVVTAGELDAPPTGDGNNTTSFVCRPAVGRTSWSEHAYGLAIDINPFHNPYQRNELILPELATAYVDRDWVRPGMIQGGDGVTAAFAEIGWGWGGEWDTVSDWMHFSRSGR